MRLWEMSLDKSKKIFCKNFQPEKNIKLAKSVETEEREITLGEQLNMILNEGNHLNNTPSHKSNHAETGKKSLDRSNGANPYVT